MADRLKALEQTFRALGDQTRLRILALLAAGNSACVTSTRVWVSRSPRCRHLAYLRRAGLVVTRKDGLWVHYSLAVLRDPVLRTVHDAVAHALREVDAVKRDAKHLAKRQPCAVPAQAC
jgi:ArsR family transcriptional regulator, arsenate/arsenite/antimonite-responsive transcriptional repressor